MSSCDAYRADLDAYRDRTLDDARAGEVEAHLRECDRCAAEIERATALETRVRRSIEGWRAPDELWATLLRDAGELEQARLRIEAALLLDPNNLTARALRQQLETLSEGG